MATGYKAVIKTWDIVDSKTHALVETVDSADMGAALCRLGASESDIEFVLDHMNGCGRVTTLTMPSVWLSVRRADHR